MPVNYAIVVNQYYLSVYPNQTPVSSPTQALARMTLQGPPDQGHPNTPAGLVFYIDFYLDCSGGLSAPSLNPVNGTVSVEVAMYYSQLAGMLYALNNAILNNGPACYAGYTDAPHAEFNVNAP